MPCYNPLTGYRSRSANPETGKRPLVFSRNEGYCDLKVEVPCGQCIGCRVSRSRDWAARCVHEASLHKDNAFVTLTFSPENIKDGSLHVEDFQKFMKRLRKAIHPQTVRFFHCGEYGSLLERPHHHACLFGYDFPDKVLWFVRDGVKLYRSAMLEKLWPYGHSTIGDVNFASAAYVARYVLKKITGEPAGAHYQGRKPEYVTMSRKPGIGHDWIARFQKDIYPNDLMIIKGGIKCRPPKYYDSIYDLTNPEDCARVRSRRKARAKESPENKLDRLAVKEKIKKQKLTQLTRGYEL